MTILEGDVSSALAGMPSEGVQCVVTSPPYWGLRDYGTASWEGGDGRHRADLPPHGAHDAEGPTVLHLGHEHPPEELCDHIAGPAVSPSSTLEGGKQPDVAMPFRGDCGKCGARRIDQQLGLEPTPEAYVERMVGVFREVRRVLRKDGTLWLNMGDGYATSPKGNPGALSDGLTNQGRNAALANGHRTRSTIVGDLKPKDLIGMPWRLAFALQADGWYLRSDIVWSKPNPMPESVTDRPTKAHEYLFLLTRSPRYFYDADAVREAVEHPELLGQTRNVGTIGTANGLIRPDGLQGGAYANPAGRNLRTVWTIPTEPFPEAHFATFPKRLVEPCIKAGTSERGCCPECGAPWRREVERQPLVLKEPPVPIRERRGDAVNDKRTALSGTQLVPASSTTTGWKATCLCVGGIYGDVPMIVPCTVLDPFAGSGTTGVVAAHLGRDFIGIELSPEYAAMARRRIAGWRREYAERPAPKVSDDQTAFVLEGEE